MPFLMTWLCGRTVAWNVNKLQTICTHSKNRNAFETIAVGAPQLIDLNLARWYSQKWLTLMRCCLTITIYFSYVLENVCIRHGDWWAAIHVTSSRWLANENLYIRSKAGVSQDVDIFVNFPRNAFFQLSEQPWEITRDRWNKLMVNWVFFCIIFDWRIWFKYKINTSPMNKNTQPSIRLEHTLTIWGLSPHFDVVCMKRKHCEKYQPVAMENIYLKQRFCYQCQSYWPYLLLFII